MTRPGTWADSLTGLGAGARTDGEITRLHAQTATAGVATTAAAAWLDVSTSWPLLDSLALVGAAAGSVLTAATVTHRAWWTHPTTRLRRSLGGPVGWLDAHDLNDTCSATAVRRHAAGLWPQRDHHQGPVSWAGWEAGQLVSGPRRLRGRRVYSPWTRGIGILGPQGSGKTQYLIGLLLQAPGAVVVPSTNPSSRSRRWERGRRSGRWLCSTPPPSATWPPPWPGTRSLAAPPTLSPMRGRGRWCAAGERRRGRSGRSSGRRKPRRSSAPTSWPP